MPGVLFEAKLRQDDTPQRYTESKYDFYDRSPWPAMENIRQLLNQWISDYPESERREIIKRFQSEFDPAFFELWTYIFFRKLGFSLEPHPALENTSKRCDFLAKDDTRKMYLECISIDGLSAEERARRNTLNYFYDLINAMNCPNFYLQLVEVNFKGTSYPPLVKIRTELENQVNLIDPYSIGASAIQSFNTLPVFNHENPKFRLRIKLIPKTPGSREKKGRNIGVFEMGTHIGGYGYAIADAIKRKAAKYGKLPAPFLIAINTLTDYPIDEYDIEDALFGNLAPTRVSSILKGELSIPSNAESSWFVHGKAIHTRVTAVLVTNVTPSNLGNAKYWLYFNPMAVLDLDMDNLQLNNYRIDKRGIKTYAGKTIAEILNITADWPGERSFQR